MKDSVLVALVLGAWVSATASAAEFRLDPKNAKNRVRFESRAPMESFEGKTHRVSGSIDCDPAALADSVTVLVEVDLASLDTGIALRNKHMRENHLHTDKYPKAVFHGGHLTDLSARSLQPGQTVRFTLEGTFELHGVARRMAAPVMVTLQADKSLRIVTHFQVKLSDFRIDRPKFLLLKLDETQRITVDVTAAPGSASPSS